MPDKEVRDLWGVIFFGFPNALFRISTRFFSPYLVYIKQVGGSIPSWDAKKIKNSAAFRVAEFFFFKDFSDLERYLLTLVSQQKDGGLSCQ